MTNNEQHERKKTARETLGKFFYDLAKATFVAMVISAILTLSQLPEGSLWPAVITLAVGVACTTTLAFIGDYIIKH